MLAPPSLGARVSVQYQKQELEGTCRFYGDTQFAKDKWVGIVLDEAIGKNDGSVAGVRYFECPPLHGIFVKLSRVTAVLPDSSSSEAGAAEALHRPPDERLQELLEQCRPKGETPSGGKKGRRSVSEETGLSWTLSEWLSSLFTFPSVAELLAEELGGDLSEGGRLQFLKALGKEKDTHVISHLLASRGVLESLAEILLQGARELNSEAAAAAGRDVHLHHKFQQEPPSLRRLPGRLDGPKGGLGLLVGAPEGRSLLEAMWREHCAEADSDEKFTTSGYWVTTTPSMEWAFVFDPEGSLDASAELRASELEAKVQGLRSPTTTRAAGSSSRLVEPQTESSSEDLGESFKKFCAEKEGWRSKLEGSAQSSTSRAWPSEERMDAPEHRRQPVCLADFREELHRLNGLLERAQEPPLLVEELIGARLLTGPMLEKYNESLRHCWAAHAGQQEKEEGQAATEERKEGELLSQSSGKTNKYAMTLHVINSAIMKLSKVLPAMTVYRGMRGALLPPQLWEPNSFNVRGGWSLGFVSATKNKFMAMVGTPVDDNTGTRTVFEVKVGREDQGADLAWLSQYPHEAEITFGPLVGLEIMRSTVETLTLVVEARLSRMLTTGSTVEQLISKQKKISVLADAKRFLTEHSTLQFMHDSGSGAVRRAASTRGHIELPT